MNYAEQMQEFMRSWVEAQKKMASQWKGFTPQPPKTPEWDPQLWIKRWQETARSTTEAMLRNTKGVPKEVGEKVIEGSNTYLRFIDFFFEAMKEVSPKVDAGADWAQAFAKHLEELRSAFPANAALWADPGGSSSDVGELWKIYLAQSRFLVQPWLDSFRESQGHMSEAMLGDRTALQKMVSLFTDTYESTLGKFLSAPAIGYTREYQEKLADAFESWMEVRKEEANFKVELINVGMTALDALADALKGKAEKGEKITSPRKLFNLWVEIAEKVYFKAASSEKFSAAQGRFVNAAMRYRSAELVLFEETYKACYLPTRSELDDAYRHLYEFRKELKILKKQTLEMSAELAELKKSAEAGGPAGDAAPPASPAAGSVPKPTPGRTHKKAAPAPTRKAKKE